MMPRAGSPPIVRSSSASCCVRTKARPSAASGTNLYVSPFRAAPDLYLWDGETIPLQVGYRFPSESWINEDKSLLSVTLNGTFLNNLPMNKQGPLEKVWRYLGAMRARALYHPAGALPDLRR